MWEKNLMWEYREKVEGKKEKYKKLLLAHKLRKFYSDVTLKHRLKRK